MSRYFFLKYNQVSKDRGQLKIWLQISLLPILCCMTSCMYRDDPAPVNDAWFHHQAQNNVHTVSRKETLYAIAWRYDLDYRDLAAYNRLQAPYELRIGQQLHLPKSKEITITAQQLPLPSAELSVKNEFHTTPPTKFKIPPSPVTLYPVSRWQWPLAHAKIISTFSLKRNKGIDLSALKGAPVYASAAGVIAYSGDGIRGYGNLIIVKHNDEYFSAYGHNERLWVREGQRVKQGQRIASLGHWKKGRGRLHFEIRRAGKPVDPLRFLPSMS